MRKYIFKISKEQQAKSSHTRRNRGYAFERSLVTKFNNTDGWAARRLGGSSTGLPDVVATNKEKSILYAIECKSGLSNILPIPFDQITRCIDIVNNFLTAYKNRYVVFAFKFPKTEIHDLQYRFVICTNFKLPDDFKGVAYNIKKDTFIVPKFGATQTAEIELIDNKITSIAEFVNFL